MAQPDRNLVLAHGKTLGEVMAEHNNGISKDTKKKICLWLVTLNSSFTTKQNYNLILEELDFLDPAIPKRAQEKLKNIVLNFIRNTIRACRESGRHFTNSPGNGPNEIYIWADWVEEAWRMPLWDGNIAAPRLDPGPLITTRQLLALSDNDLCKLHVSTMEVLNERHIRNHDNIFQLAGWRPAFVDIPTRSQPVSEDEEDHETPVIPQNLKRYQTPPVNDEDESRRLSTYTPLKNTIGDMERDQRLTREESEDLSDEEGMLRAAAVRGKKKGHRK